MKEIKEPEAYRFIYERLNKTLDELTDESSKEFINIINELRIENLQLKSKIQNLEHILKENNIEVDKKLTMKF